MGKNRQKVNEREKEVGKKIEKQIFKERKGIEGEVNVYNEGGKEEKRKFIFDFIFEVKNQVNLVGVIFN